MWLQTWAEPKRVPPEAWSCRTASPLQGKQGNELLLCLNMLLVRPGHIAQGLPSFHPSSELSSYRVRLKPDAALFSVLGVVPLGSSRYLRRVSGGKCTLTFYPKQTHPLDRRIVFFLPFQRVTDSRCSLSINICGIIERLYIVAAGQPTVPWSWTSSLRDTHLIHFQKIALPSRVTNN